MRVTTVLTVLKNKVTEPVKAVDAIPLLFVVTTNEAPAHLELILFIQVTALFHNNLLFQRSASIVAEYL